MNVLNDNDKSDVRSNSLNVGFEDIRPAHGFMFKRILPNGATGIELAEYLGISKQAISKMVDSLENSGYVTRKTHPNDKSDVRSNSLNVG
ncbi:MarR family winged helix-turn-helix transcriptional regulator, partial [Bacillus sp. D-CC]